MKPTVCLSMIVKDEAPVIARCLESVMPYIDRAVICDTGSTDDTMQIIFDVFKKHGKVVDVYAHPWVNFASNRNRALDIARNTGTDYVLFIDADETLVGDGKRPPLTGDGYMLKVEYGGWTYYRNAIVSAKLPWKWVGVIHEYLTCDGDHKWEYLDSPKIFVRHDGARARDPNTYKKDIALLEQAVADEPENTRYWFYLAQSYKDAGRTYEAVTTYLKRASMGGWDEEVWYSTYQAGKLSIKEDSRNTANAAATLLQAWQLRPWRAEPLVVLAEYHRLRREYELAYMYATMAQRLPYPSKDKLFIDNAVYDYKALDELSLAGYYAKTPDAFECGYVAAERVVAEKKFPKDQEQRLLDNLQCFRANASSRSV